MEFVKFLSATSLNLFVTLLVIGNVAVAMLFNYSDIVIATADLSCRLDHDGKLREGRSCALYFLLRSLTLPANIVRIALILAGAAKEVRGYEPTGWRVLRPFKRIAYVFKMLVKNEWDDIADYESGYRTTNKTENCSEKGNFDSSKYDMDITAYLDDKDKEAKPES